MKRISLILILMLGIFNLGISQSASAILKPDLGKKLGQCPVCGMDVFEKMLTRVDLIADDGTVTHACALGCATALMDKHIYREVKVMDFYTGKMININDAVFVVGSNVVPAHAMLPAFAFLSSQNAKYFVNKHGGKILSSREMLKKAREIRMERMSMKKKKK